MKVSGLMLGMFVLIAGATSCENYGRADFVEDDDKMEITDFAEVIYNYTAPSTGSSSHRSYSIEVADSVVLLAVSDNDSVLLQKQFSISNDKQSELKKIVFSLRDAKEMTHTGEKGADAEAILITRTPKAPFQLYWNQNETKEVTTLVEFLKGLTGNIDELVQSTVAVDPIIDSAVAVTG